MVKRFSLSRRAALQANCSRISRRLREVEETLQAIRSGKVDAILASTARGQQVLTLESADSAYRALVEGMSEGIVTLNREGIILYCNRRFSEILKAPMSRIVSSKIWDWILQADWSRFTHLQKRAGSGGARGELSLHSAEQTIPVQISINLVRLDGKQAISCIVTDITVLKQTESILQLRNRALEASTEAIFIAGCAPHANPIEYVNPAFEKITGLSAVQVVGKDLLEVQSQLCRGQDLSKIRQALQDKCPGHAITHNTRPDGTRFWSDLHIAPVSAAAGEPGHFVGIQNDISESMAYQSRLEYQANHDVLTGLPNRNLLNERLQQAISTAKRSGRLMALVFVDLDHFKFVNDNLGHDVGDLVLQAIAQRLVSCLRDADTAARPGGDEFLLILVEQESTDSISAVIRRLLDVIAQPIQVGQQSLHVTCSIGISLYAQDGESATVLLKNADTAMYHAKETGRNNFQFFNDAMNVHVHERFMLESSLREAMAEHSLILAYQPQIDIASGQMIGVEALLRWNHPAMGSVPPARFIPIAEESGLIIDLGEWVLRTACAQAKTWQDAGFPPITLAVNLSARQFRHNNLADLVTRILAETGLAPQYLELELTESLALEDSEKFMRTLTRLKKLGLQLTIDDFGTGYSSLSYLKNLPLDRLKIDISFIDHIVRDQGDAAIAQIIILLGHSLHLKVIAEGVETNEQWKLLHAQGCDEIQGFFYSQPLSGAEMEKFMRTEGRSIAGDR